MSLIKSLPRIAAKVLHNTHVGLKGMKEKYELLAVAYGSAAVEADFEVWCEEQVKAGINPRYPFTAYIKVVDARFGQKFVEPSESQIDTTDPQVTELASAAYEATGYAPSKVSVAKLLRTYTVAQIVDAMNEYTSTLEEREMKSGMREFFVEGVAETVIFTQTRRRQSPVFKIESKPKPTDELFDAGGPPNVR